MSRTGEGRVDSHPGAGRARTGRLGRRLTLTGDESPESALFQSALLGPRRPREASRRGLVHYLDGDGTQSPDAPVERRLDGGGGARPARFGIFGCTRPGRGSCFRARPAQKPPSLPAGPCFPAQHVGRLAILLRWALPAPRLRCDPPRLPCLAERAGRPGPAC